MGVVLGPPTTMFLSFLPSSAAPIVIAIVSDFGLKFKSNFQRKVYAAGTSDVGVELAFSIGLNKKDGGVGE